jgi:hypothetical protein
MVILHQKCEPVLAKDKKLPRDSYLISYIEDDKVTYDIARGAKVELFDYYYDNFGEVLGIKWTEGTMNPKTYDYIPKENKKKR